jgi:hypothetical protein
MEAKWIIISILGLFGLIRVVQPQFFAHWIKGNFNDIEEGTTTFVASALLWIAFVVLSGLSLWSVQLNVPFLLTFVAIPAVYIGRWVLAQLLYSMNAASRNAILWNINTQLPRIVALYGILAILMQVLTLSGLSEKVYFETLFFIGHFIGLVWFAFDFKGFVHFNSRGLRVYSILYLCALEIIPLYLATR